MSPIETSLVNSGGLHMRPIQALLMFASSQPAEVTLSAYGKRASIRSAMDLMLLGASFGTQVRVESNAGLKAASSVVEFLEREFPRIDCKNSLMAYASKIPHPSLDLVAEMITTGDVGKGERNDLFYWTGGTPSEETVHELALSISGVLAIDKLTGRPTKYAATKNDLLQLDLVSRSGSQTAYIELPEYLLLRYCEEELVEFRNIVSKNMEGFLVWKS